jgi:acyl-CoA synthetase (AMP-forming)/AMP-acid ligase II
MSDAHTLGALLAEAARTDGTASAFRYGAERITYAAWDALASRVAGGLAAAGVSRGDVVALLLPTTPLYMACYLGAARLGAVTTGINVRYRRTEIGHILRRSGARLLLAVEHWHDTDFRAIVDALGPGLPELRHARWVGAEQLRANTIASLDALALDGPPPATAPDPDDPAAIVWTSGTTGIPKGAWYAHRSLLALADIEARRHVDGLPRRETHLASGLSFAHVGAMARIAVQLRSHGETLIYDAFDPATVLAAVERERIANLGAFPTQAIMLLDHPDRPRRDLSSLRTVLLGGAPSSPALIRRVRETLGVRVAVRYSSTEVGIATGSLPDDPIEVLAATVGKPTPGVELRVADAEGHPLPADAIGQVLVRSPATMCGYWRDPEATAATMDPDGWVRTGDLGWLDAAGYLHLRGRQSEMFIRGGFNVYPGEIEDLLARHPKIARAAVVGLPDDTFGEVGWAFVVPRDPADPPALAELRAYVGGELASFKRPDGVTVLEDLPVTPMFKVDKQVLKALGRGGMRT